MEINELAAEVFQVIVQMYDQKLHKIGSVLRQEAAKLALRDVGGHKYIYDKGDFKNSLDYKVEILPKQLNVTLLSNAPHAPFVLGGKVPSWTPMEPLQSWVERKKLNWTDKRSGRLLSVEEMAWLIARKIKREGIPERNVWQQVVTEKLDWVRKELEG